MNNINNDFQNKKQRLGRGLGSLLAGSDAGMDSNALKSEMLNTKQNNLQKDINQVNADKKELENRVWQKKKQSANSRASEFN